MRKLTIAFRLATGFGAVLFLMALITIVGVQRVTEMDYLLMEVNEGAATKQRFAINFRGSVHDRAISLRDAILVSSTTDLEKHLEDIARLDKFYQDSAAPMDNWFASHNGSTNEQRLLRAIKDIEKMATSSTENLIKLRKSGDISSAKNLLLNETSALYTDWLNAINAFIDDQESYIRKDIGKVQEIAGKFGSMMVIITILASLLSATIAWRIVKYIQSSLGAEPTEVAAIMNKLSSGDLKVQKSTDYRDSVLASVNNMVRQLSSIIDEVRMGADEVSHSSTSLQETSAETSHQMQNQSSETEQMATAIEEMATTVKDVSDMASQADSIANLVDNEVKHGNDVVHETAQAMTDLSNILEEAAHTVSEVSSQSENIEKIIEVINSIAEQTNLLALNAAIEAARAGEHGRGFAVVADEVRSLASRTQQSTREISTMIGQLQNGAEKAMVVMGRSQMMAGQTRERTERSRAALDTIRDRVIDITEMIKKIAEAAEQQSQVAHEVSVNISRIHGLTQETTNNSLKVERFSENLLNISKRLSEKVSFFH